jgi:hypothetical protein
MYSMGAKLGYLYQIYLFGGVVGGAILLTKKSDVMCRILWASTSWSYPRSLLTASSQT